VEQQGCFLGREKVVLEVNLSAGNRDRIHSSLDGG
jgi:hypothetical protein